ncbi:senecionine N-oxygenase-like [Paramuricea clavata]|uniref:Flavin-containing monooxygenase n=1 Tax=Paramuricea clavata TaxID=317549 RepID=A0A7D9DBT4_PARCT|nr:senecionine N-oxygenase-like [Paramuricea clavata]
MPQKKRVCIIGAGPSGMSTMYHFDKLKKQGTEIPDVVCYEKQSDCGGLWNYSWRTGTDEFGEVVHNSMYRNLWSNGPKEALEFPDYTFDEHFGKPIASFPPREVLFDYLKGRWAKADVRSWINLNHKVHDVQYNAASDNFTVQVKDLVNDRYLSAQTFDYVIVATGHFSMPHLPDFPGLNKFPGRVMHAHSFRDAREFKDKRLLLIGASYSAEDISLQLAKYGAGNIICTYRTRPMGFKWPDNISERPLLVKVDGNTVHFKDGSTAEVDAIISCTGYLYSYPFLKDASLQLKTGNVLFPDGLYKNTLWIKGGNKKLMYLAAQDQCYTYTLFDIQAKWCVKYIMGEITLPSQAAMEEDVKKWVCSGSLMSLTVELFCSSF